MNEQLKTQLADYIRTDHACIFMPTQEEQFARRMISEVALEVRHKLWVWSVVKGLRKGLPEADESIENTKSPDAALEYIAGEINEEAICVMYDLVDYLSETEHRRYLRHTIRSCQENAQTLILVDYNHTLPDVLASEVTHCEVPLPDEDELHEIAKDQARKILWETSASASITEKQFQTIVRNLSGLTRRQARRVIKDAILEDFEFNEKDINRVLGGC